MQANLVFEEQPMKRKQQPSRAIPERLGRTWAFLTNALLDEDLLDRLAMVKITLDDIRDAMRDWDRAEELYHLAYIRHAEAMEVSEEFRTMLAEARDTYMWHVRIARVQFTNNREAHKILQLKGERKRTHEALIAQMERFYQAALEPETKHGLKQRGISRQTIQAQAKVIQQLKCLDLQHSKRHMLATKTTMLRNQVLYKVEQFVRGVRSLTHK